MTAGLTRRSEVKEGESSVRKAPESESAPDGDAFCSVGVASTHWLKLVKRKKNTEMIHSWVVNFRYEQISTSEVIPLGYL